MLISTLPFFPHQKRNLEEVILQDSKKKKLKKEKKEQNG